MGIMRYVTKGILTGGISMLDPRTGINPDNQRRRANRQLREQTRLLQEQNRILRAQAERRRG